MFSYRLIARRSVGRSLLHDAGRFTCSLTSSQPVLLLPRVPNRQLSVSCAACQKQERAETRQDKGDGKEQKSLEADVPLIVRLLRQNQTQFEPKAITAETDSLSVEQLQKKLEDITWDAVANIRRRKVEGLESEEEKKIEESLDQVEKDVTEDGIPELRFIEDIYLDSEVPLIRNLNPKGKSKTKPKMKGTPDPSIPKSGVPCSGCGAELHCQDPIIPGYMPSEKFTCLTREDMRTSICQRCFLINVHNMFLNVRVSADTYPTIMHEIKHTQALVIVVVDLFDMKNSVFKDLLKSIGRNRPLFIVGNKVDLIPKDRSGYLERTEQKLLEVCESMGLNPTGKNIKHTCLVSAKTGYGVEQLVTKLMLAWPQKGHVYVVGSTNVGKSTLFNALLMSDYCKSHARGFINRATVSVWPGTTLNLLKFPIVNPSGWRLALRTKRLQKDSEEWVKEQQLKKSQLKEAGSYKAAVLTGHIGLTDFRGRKTIEEDVERESSGQDILSFSQSTDGQVQEVSGRHTLPPQPKEIEYKPEGVQMYWCNDTPGVINPEQIINLLEPEELVTVLPKSLIQPLCVVIKPGQVLFVTGMGRVDYVKGDKSVYLTVHAAYKLPLHVKESHEADAFYQEALGTDTLGVPMGDADRLQRMPALVGREFHVTGVNWEQAAADIQLSSLGWVSVAAGQGMQVTLRAYTPGARGLHLRSPPLLPDFTTFRGKRRGKTPFYRPVKPRD